MSIASQILGDEGAQSLGDLPSIKLACTMGPCVSLAESLDVCLLGAAIDPDSLDSHSLFVGDLPHELSDTELHQHFQAFFPSAKSAKVGCTPWPAVIVSCLCTLFTVITVAIHAHKSQGKPRSLLLLFVHQKHCRCSAVKLCGHESCTVGLDVHGVRMLQTSTR